MGEGRSPDSALSVGTTSGSGSGGIADNNASVYGCSGAA